MIRRLIIGKIPDDFNFSFDIPLGPWCFLGKETEIKNWETICFEKDSYTNTTELKFAEKEASIFAKLYLFELAKYLNLHHKANYSVRFWNILLMPWLLTLVQVFRDRSSRIDAIIKKYEKEIIEVDIVEDIEKWNFNSTSDFFNKGVFSPEFNTWLFSRLIEKKCPSGWRINRSPFPENANILPPPIVKTLKTRVKSLLFDDFRFSGVYGISKLNWFFSLLLALKKQSHVSISLKTEEKYENVTFSWTKDFDIIAKKTLPKIFLSKFILKKIRFKNEYVIGPYLFYNEEKKLEIATNLDKGAKVSITQHGGNYGNANVFSLAAEIEFTHSNFISWGWTNQEDYNVNAIPLPSPLLSKKSNYKKQNNQLIFVGTRVHMYMYRFDSMPQPSEQIIYLKYKLDFLQKLNTSIFQNTLYRPYPNHLGCLNDKSYILFHFSDLKICEGHLHPQLARCKLAVLDHPGTTLNVNLATNIPTILFWQKDVWAFSKQSQPYFDELHRVGILHYEGQSAAHKVNEIWSDIDNWWNSKDVQNARIEWSNQFAKTSKNWCREWIKYIWNS